MNHSAITKEALLKAAWDILLEEGIDKLNIRRLAGDCGISVGCIYNYFPSKSDLVFALVEQFWYGIFHQARPTAAPPSCFPDFLEDAYQRLLSGIKEFNTDFLSQLSRLKLEDKTKGRELEERYWSHMKKGLRAALDADRQILSSTWTEEFTKTDFLEFVFTAMMSGLKKQDPDIHILTELIRKTMYTRQV